MIDERMDALTAVQEGLVTHDQAVAHGLTQSAIRHQRRTRRWTDVHRGVYRVAGAPETPRLRARAATLAGGPSAALSHTSASALLRLPGFTIDPVTISILRGRREIKGVRVEQSLALPGHHVTVVDGIPCTTIARTLFDLCGDVTARRAERALDAALARKLVRLPELWRVLDELAEHGRAGTVLFRTLLTEREPDYVPPESELEARFIELTKRHGLVIPEKQVDLGDDDGWIGRVDFVFRGARIVVEVDGAEFHDGLVDQRSDEERDARLTAAGWHVLRLRWNDVVDRGTAVARAIRFRGELPSL